MDRRKFLARASASVVGLCSIVERAFAEEPCTPDDQATARVFSAFRRARRAGKLMLVFVIPSGEDWAERSFRGHAFGEWLNHGTDEQLAPIAMTEIVCASRADVEKVVDVPGRSEPLMILIDPSGDTPSVRLLDVVLPRIDRLSRRSGDWEAIARLEDRTITERIATLAAAVAGAIMPDSRALDRRVLDARRALGNERIQRVRELATQGARLSRRHVSDAAAVMIQLAHDSDPSDRVRILSSVADAVRYDVVEDPPPGTRWATSGGCGGEVEKTRAERAKDEEARKNGQVVIDTMMVVGCGMGHVPAKSQRFLDFYTRG